MKARKSKANLAKPLWDDLPKSWWMPCEQDEPEDVGIHVWEFLEGQIQDQLENGLVEQLAKGNPPMTVPNFTADEHKATEFLRKNLRHVVLILLDVAADADNGLPLARERAKLVLKGMGYEID